MVIAPLGDVHRRKEIMAILTFAAIAVGSFEAELGIYEISSKYGIRSIDHVRHVIALGRDTYSE